MWWLKSLFVLKQVLTYFFARNFSCSIYYIYLPFYLGMYYNQSLHKLVIYTYIDFLKILSKIYYLYCLLRLLLLSSEVHAIPYVISFSTKAKEIIYYLSTQNIYIIGSLSIMHISAFLFKIISPSEIEIFNLYSKVY